MKLRLKVLFSLVLMVSLVVPTTFISFIAYQQKVAQNEQSQSTIRRLTLNRSKDRIESYLTNTLDYVRVDSNIPQFAEFLASSKTKRQAMVGEINAILRNVTVKDTLNVTSVALIDLNGRNVQDINIAQQGRNESRFVYFTEQQQTVLPIMAFVDAKQNDPESIYFSAPVRSSQGNVVGYLRMMLETSVIGQLLNQISQHITHTSWLTISKDDTPIADSRSQFSEDKEQHMRYVSAANIKPFGWQITLFQPAHEHDKAVAEYRQFLILQQVALLIVAFVVSLVIARILIRPVERVKQLAIEIAHDNLDQRIDDERVQEFSELAMAINKMADKLVKSYRELAEEHEELALNKDKITELNAQLEKRVSERTQQLSAQNEALENAMEQIVQSEKLASLGSLVSGVAHELNTPLGVALTAGSFALDIHAKVNQELETKTLTSHSLNSHLAELFKAVNLVIDNCYKASDLVNNFKQISGDHTSNSRRKFNLEATLGAVISTLQGKLQPNYNVTMSGLSSLEVDSFPGAFEQVFIHLINNSIVHGFASKTQGEINISASVDELHNIVITYSDDGVGIDGVSREKIFDPFFTTRLGEGSSGLGLYIVFNLVTGVLGGKIRLCQTALGKGVKFEIVMPIQSNKSER